MHVEYHAVGNETPEQFQRLSQQDPAFARLAQQFADLEQRLTQIEQGSETLDPASLTALKDQHTALKGDFARQLKCASGSCCGGCCG